MQIIKREIKKGTNFFTVKFSPNRISRFFGAKDKIIVLYDSGYEYLDGLRKWINAETGEVFGRVSELDDYLRRIWANDDPEKLQIKDVFVDDLINRK